MPHDPDIQRVNRPARRSSIRWYGVGLLMIVLVGGGAGYLAIANSANDDSPKLTHTVKRGRLVVSVIEQGTLESSNNKEIKCRVRGYSKVISVIEGGSIVKPGDELVRLDTKRIEDAIGKHTTDAHVSRATYERTKADVANAEVAIDAYLEGSYRSQLKSLQRQLSIAESNLQTAEKMLAHSTAMFRRGYVSELEVEGNRFTVTQANLELRVRQNAIEVLNKYTKEMQLESLRGRYEYLQGKLMADESGLRVDEGRRDQAIRELEYCVIKADRPGMVIYPSAAEWKDTPDIAEGASVRKDQVLLLMPDLTQMEVKVGIHESIIDRVETGLSARVTLPEFDLDGQVSNVASIARPSGWWSGNEVKYDAIVDLPNVKGLKPGMSAEVEIILAEHNDVISIPVAAAVETEDETLCWVKSPQGIKRRPVELGDSNEVFVIVKSGLAEGDQVILNPLSNLEEAQTEALQASPASEQRVP